MDFKGSLAPIKGHFSFYNILLEPYWIIEHVCHTNLSNVMAANASLD